KKSVYIEFRNLAESRWYNAFSGSGFQYLPYINAILPLEGKSMEKILSGMKYNRRREIRISVEEGATFGEAQSSQEVRSLYKILHDLYRKKVKVPLPPYEMFEAIFKSHAGKIFVVKHGDMVIGGAACLLFAQKTLYTLYYCGKRDYHPRIFPTHLAIVAAIRYCLENGFHTIDFMGAGKSNVEYGVRKYKAEFGCILPEYGRYLKINNPFIYRLGKFWISTKKHYSRS
ncbi:MAG: GNAT family N-acetyltransferase, partial [Bacteroidota bacterium]|nr:GNAT family N-acetyltransferase [Bacteroidota bacterium]